MKPALGFAHRLCLVVVPVVASSAIAALPTQAGTFATSETQTVFTFSGFDPNGPFGTNTVTSTDSVVTSSGPGSVAAFADATAAIIPGFGQNTTFGQTGGDGLGYSGTADSFAQLIGSFSVDANQLFSVNFLSNLYLETSVDDPATETASAFSFLQYQLFDLTNNQELDSFTFQRRISSETGLSNLLTAQINGAFSYRPTSRVDLGLIGVQISQAEVTAIPAPGGVLGLLGTGLMFCIKKWRTKLKDDSAVS